MLTFQKKVFVAAKSILSCPSYLNSTNLLEVFRLEPLIWETAMHCFANAIGMLCCQLENLLEQFPTFLDMSVFSLVSKDGLAFFYLMAKWHAQRGGRISKNSSKFVCLATSRYVLLNLY
jgi:hypothetical protein